MEQQTTSGAQTLMRGLTIIQAVADGHHQLSTIGNAIGCTRSTTQRLASTLVKAGFLRQSGTTYNLGSKLLEFGFQARESLSLPKIARPYLEKLASETLDTIHLGVREHDEVLYLDKISSQRGLEMRSRIGKRMPLALTGIGKALMLDMSAQEWRSLYQSALHQNNQFQNTAFNIETYLANMAVYAKQGVSFDFEENEKGIHCVAAPIRDASSKIIAAISVASALPYMPKQRMSELAPQLVESVQAISRQLGWNGQSQGFLS